MSEELNIQQLIEAFTSKASERYELAAKDTLISNLTEIAPVCKLPNFSTLLN